MREFVSRMGVIGEMLSFLWRRKLYWMIPMILVLLIFALLVAVGGSPLAPFIYPIF